MTPKEQAKRAAEYLFTNGAGEKAVRLTLIGQAGYDIGGWGFDSVVKVIEGQIEEWRPIPGYEAIYEASSMGRVRRVTAGGNTHPGKILQPVNHNGYRRVKLCGRAFRVHRLVMLAFVGPTVAGQEVNHKNGNKTDNRLCNLEYITHLENMEHAKAHELTPPFERRGLRHCPDRAARGANHPRAKLTEEIVKEIRRAWSVDAVPIRELARLHALAYGTVQQVVYRRTWRHVE